MSTKTIFTVTAGEAMMQIEGETPQEAAENATEGLKNILSAHVTLGRSEYPVDMTVTDSAGKEYVFTL